MPKTVVIPANDDVWDSEKGVFISVKEQKLVVEHSLISLSKWERITKKSFPSNIDKLTAEEWLLYIKCMTLNNVSDTIYNYLTTDMFHDIIAYINDPMTATTITDFRKGKNKAKKETITSELIYYKMISYGIPLECAKWHLNTLVTLISVFDVKDNGQGKMSRRESMEFNRALNASRRGKGRKR